MRRVVLDEPGRLRTVDVPAPRPGPGEVLLQMRRVGVCGTDLHAFHGRQPFFSYPRVLGHELAGEVAGWGEGVTGISVGDPVAVVPYLGCGVCIACRGQRPNCCESVKVLGIHVDGGLQEQLVVPASAVEVAKGLDWDQCVLVECLAVGAHAVSRAAPAPGEGVLVIGAGPIGLAVGQAARSRGAKVVMTDRNSARLTFWRETLGGKHCLDPGDDREGSLREILDGDLATCVIDATGNAESMISSLEVMAHGGRLVFVGLSKQPIGWPQPEFHKKETTLMASRNATHADFREVIAALREGTTQASCMVTHRTDLERLPEDFESFLDPASGAVKALIEP